MRVEGPRSSTSANGARKNRPSGSGFQLPEAGEAAATGGDQVAPSAVGVTGLDAILALQSVDNPEDRSKRAVRHGHDLLDQLEALRADLLAGHVSPQRIGALLSLVRAQQGSDDPKLASLIDDIALRAKVELAKLNIDV